MCDKLIMRYPHGYFRGGFFAPPLPSVTISNWQDNNFLTTIEMEDSNFSEIELRQDSVVEPLGDCRFRVDGRTLRFAIRKLTPRECLRLMDVDEQDIDKIQQAGISNSQQYKLAGNSIVVSTLYHIFRKLFIDTEAEYKRGDILHIPFD